jgi:hypothetical protein
MEKEIEFLAERYKFYDFEYIPPGTVARGGW